MDTTIFIDTTLCTACRGCQVACKQWHDLPAEKTVNRGTYQNPADLSFNTYKLVRMSEQMVDGKLHWLFFPDQCRHCLEPPCRDTADDARAIFTDDATGAVIYTANTRNLDAAEVIESCPYDVPRRSADGTLAKCDLCYDRVQNGLAPACVKVCGTGAMNFGARKDMLSLAEKRLKTVQAKFPNAALLDPGDVRVIYLVAHDPGLYHKNAVAAVRSPVHMTRKMALRQMLRPFNRKAVRFPV